MTMFDFASEVISEADLSSRVDELGAALGFDYEGRDPLFVIMLTGSVPFGADLVRAVHMSAEVDFLGLNRYGESGKIGVAMDLSTPVLGRNVVLVEDIVDTGLTLTVLRRWMLNRGASSVSTVALLDKTARRVTEVPVEYRGFEVGDEFLVGYGLDWQGLYRNLRTIWAVLDIEAFVENPRVLLDALAAASPRPAGTPTTST